MAVAGDSQRLDKGGEYGLKVTATLTPDYVYTKTTDAPDLNLVILVNEKVAYSEAKKSGTYRSMADATWFPNFQWKPGDRVGLRLVDADPFSSDTIVELSWEASDRMPLAGTVDLSKVLGYTATGCSVTFEVFATPDNPTSAPRPKDSDPGGGPPPLDPGCYRDSPCCQAQVSLVIVATERTEADARVKAAALARTHGWALEPELKANTDGYDGYLPPAAHPWFDGSWGYLAVVPTNFLKGLKPELWVVLAYSERTGTGGVSGALSRSRGFVPDAYRREAEATHCVGGFH